ncbi:hypothetical protein [Ancylomarina sp. 16SWW S1-10-2]|uniref:hypothetical protein n=1 Tax=Ancylomarina sp. 16SWW S1-10-2 TaxID=2499681 RepID=UPI0012AE2CAA|nr:hypothetical protein [Ancylomarina sp. 16SWW S1-10-2]MRT94578.1 hypothetical protein [Ancylomarina sp. 16SWW S1-10-2]
MKKQFYNQEGFLSTLFTVVLIFAIAIATEYFDSLFVHDTGHIKIFGGIGVVLAIALLFRLKFVRYILSIITLLAIVATLFMLYGSGGEFVYAHSVLLVSLSLIAYFLVFSNSVQNYVGRK